MATIAKRRMDRCRNCFCLMELPASKWFCDKYQKGCVDIHKCGEFGDDPSIRKRKK